MSAPRNECPIRDACTVAGRLAAPGGMDDVMRRSFLADISVERTNNIDSVIDCEKKNKDKCLVSTGNMRKLILPKP